MSLTKDNFQRQPVGNQRRALAVFLLCWSLIQGCSTIENGDRKNLVMVSNPPAVNRYAINSGLTTAGVHVVRNADAWLQLWARITSRQRPAPLLPDIDFDTHMVIVVALGQRRSGGYSVSINSARIVGDELLVAVTETCPAPGTIVTQQVTTPMAAVILPARDEPVRMIRDEVDCGN